MSHPAVHEVAVVGVADEHWGEIVRAHIVPEAGREIDEADLREYCRTRIAGYKVPALYELQDELPRNASGKVLKRELRQL